MTRIESFTAGDPTRGRNAEPAALQKLAEIECLCAASRQALRILDQGRRSVITQGDEP